MPEHELVREPASSPCQAPPGYWDGAAPAVAPYTVLERLWDMLGRVRSLSFVARSGKSGGWNGTGVGTVVIRRPGERTMIFTESGTWRPEVGTEARFGNVFRWTWAGELLRLEYLRFGEDHPVFLFDLAPGGEREWRSVSPHQCSEDCYAAVLTICNDNIVLRWSIDGPRKQEAIEYVYSWQDAAT
jgi:hypothetical protein